MKTINTIVKDIYSVVEAEGQWFTAPRLADFGVNLSAALNQPERVPGLRLSQMGEKCPSQLWHSVHSSLDAEPIQPWARIKFDYGHILEAYVIELAKAAGHTVTGEQDVVTLDGVQGHIDCIIDGAITDVKSVNSLGFQKVKSGLVGTDQFLSAYLDQLDGYVVASAGDSRVSIKDKGYILFIDKVLGKLHLYEHEVRPEQIHKRISEYKQIVRQEERPRCTCGTKTEDNGNIRLDTKASYNPYKYCCQPGLRCFIYSGGPQYFVKVIKRPAHHGKPLQEVDKFGNYLYT